MKDEKKTRKQLISELAELRKIDELEKVETERKRVEEAYRTVVEHSLQGLVMVQDFRFVVANQAFAEISGYTIEELLSLSPEEVKAVVHPEDQALVWGRFRDRVAGKPMPPRYEYRGIRKDGTVRWLEMFANAIEYHGRPAVQAVILDITERKRAEEEIRRRITELAAFEEIGRAIASTMKLDELWELIYHQTCRVMEVSAFYIGLYDQEREEVHFVIDMLHGEHRPEVEKARRFAEGRTEYIIRTKKPVLIQGDVQETYDRLGIVSADKRSKALAGAPIIAGDEVIGVLAVQNYERDDAYDEHTIELLSTIADQAAIAIENARLYEET